MITKSAAFVMLAAGAATVGFVVGYGIGKETRAATSSNVTTDYTGGVVTIKADLGKSLQDGFKNWLAGQ